LKKQSNITERSVNNIDQQRNCQVFKKVYEKTQKNRRITKNYFKKMVKERFVILYIAYTNYGEQNYGL